jgi:hypothetical protein
MENPPKRPRKSIKRKTDRIREELKISMPNLLKIPRKDFLGTRTSLLPSSYPLESGEQEVERPCPLNSPT